MIILLGRWGGGGGGGGGELQYSTAVLSICLLPHLTFEQVPAAAGKTRNKLYQLASSVQSHVLDQD